MIETLNEYFPDEIAMNILKFMQHPTAEALKKARKCPHCEHLECRTQRYIMTCGKCNRHICRECESHRYEKFQDYGHPDLHGDTLFCLECLIEHYEYFEMMSNSGYGNFKRGQFNRIKDNYQHLLIDKENRVDNIIVKFC
jgi:hypothetical protein